MLEKLFEKHPQPHCQTRFKSTTHIPQNKTHEVKKSKNLHPHPIYDVNPSLQTQQPKLSSRPRSPKREKKKKNLDHGDLINNSVFSKTPTLSSLLFFSIHLL
jgi:hypothetical protein